MLKVNEIFGPTIQGEGKSQGKQVVFLRLALCNLHCIWCDTPYTWNWKGTPFAHKDKYDYEAEVHPMDTQEVVQKIKSFGIKAVVVSGGEPFLQQKGLCPVLGQLKSEGYWIEIETNGTVPIMSSEFNLCLDQINCSPKLSNSKDEEKLRIKPKSLRQLVTNNKTNFKFVIGLRKDAIEALEIIEEYGLQEVYFMPQGRTRIEIENATQYVKDLVQKCKKDSKVDIHFTTRQHILDFDSKRGV